VYCPSALQAIERLAAELGPASLVVLEYHRGDAYTTQKTIDLFLAYGVTGTPTIFFNRSTRLQGGGDVQALYNTYKDEVAKTKALSPISVTARSSTSYGVLTTTVTLTNLSGETQYWLTLLGVPYRDLGISDLRYVVSDITGPVSIPNLAAGETASFKLTGVGSKMVVFLKSLSGEIIQVAQSSP
jgi:hypothetical protein